VAPLNKSRIGILFPEVAGGRIPAAFLPYVGFRTGTKAMFQIYTEDKNRRDRAMERGRVSKHQLPFEERLASEGRRLRDAAKKLPPDRDREGLIRRARQAETASQLTEWLTSPGLASPR
jgi:hypothetical protein